MPLPFMRLRARSVRGVLCALWLLALCATAQAGPGQQAVASAHPLATAAGEAIFAAGGNAFDVAVAVTAALGVTEPQGSGLGGGGFFLLHEAEPGRSVMLDARETAPGAAHRDLYLDADGEVIPGLSLDGALAAAIPGMPAALVHLAGRYGRLTLDANLAPAIRLAEAGFPANAGFQQMARFRLEALRTGADAADIFLRDGEVPEAGELIRQPDLAATLRRLAEQGIDGFYAGETAERLVAGVQAAGGIWTLEDLAGYKLVERSPLVLEHDGARIVTAPPPSSGGIAIGQILNILAVQDNDLGDDEILRVHLLVEAMRRAYRDRALYLGDPDHVNIPVTRLLSREHAAELRQGIDLDRATPSAELSLMPESSAGKPPRVESPQTSHFSVLDAEGNRVAATITLNYPFGSGFVPPGTGVLLNNEMDDFAARPGVPNAYGLIGFEANAIGPYRRPLSSMSPTFVETPERITVLGTPGGSRIITTVLHGILATLEGADAEEIVREGRFHHQYLPDHIEFESGALDTDVLLGLARRGHTLSPQVRPFGNMQVVLWERRQDRVEAASDPRGNGSAVVLPAQ
ncbi:gamma-glutamyltransferase [Thioalkalivibrio sp.]|uniref:gamma-glutamyltransferase n=1 Tax=Thioalkalivibrio sp. TaxID=2093813 RepID=UPI003976A27F